ncbi:MAG TPA: NADH-quinone oxidoreductase subunit L [Steroidobacteraceae bacterium]|nr:NADH-quinone oxidoreductase subunit L [Steroidobacteraceae bacterium]
MKETLNPNLLLAIPLLPLVAAIIAGLFGRVIGRAASHWVTIIGVAVSFGLSAHVAGSIFLHGAETFNAPVYQWLVSDGVGMQVGFLVDQLTALMMVVVTFVSLCVHVYTIGYMADDDGYQRFFSYISLFTFSMLMLVMSNNFMQLFFGWEAVGVVSYLLIGFWYKRPTAIFANMKAFLVNRVGDFGFVLGIAGVLFYTAKIGDASLLYADAFRMAPDIAKESFPIAGIGNVAAMTFICICLFIGAMGKSAQVPLHVWLPDSMEGPTPISALIHAATMVTAGIFMVARMSPLFELSETALNFVLFIGATTALFMGFLGIINNDIKRVVAYSTLSQLGYMTVALGASAYSFGIFHLMTHAFFKALLFLAAGSVIIGMHHEQDMRKMGGLAKVMPITAITCWIGSLALIGTPFFSGYYSKDLIIDAVKHQHHLHPGNGIATYAYWCVMIGVFVTAFYSFRLLFMTFHGKPRWQEGAHDHADAHAVTHPVIHAHESHGAHDDQHETHDEPDHGHHGGPPHEPGWVVLGPLVALAIPSVLIGLLTFEHLLFGGGFGESIHFSAENHEMLHEIGESVGDWLQFGLHAFMNPVFWIMAAGVFTAWAFYIQWPQIPGLIDAKLKPLRVVLENKYWFDWINENILARGSTLLGKLFWKVGDQGIIDGLAVNGSANTVGFVAGVVRRVQSGFLYSYAFWMMIGLALMLGWFLTRSV